MSKRTRPKPRPEPVLGPEHGPTFAEVVERMGGRIGVSSAAGRGALFWIEVPVPAEAQPARRAPIALSA